MSHRYVIVFAMLKQSHKLTIFTVDPSDVEIETFRMLTQSLVFDSSVVRNELLEACKLLQASMQLSGLILLSSENPGSEWTLVDTEAAVEQLVSILVLQNVQNDPESMLLFERALSVMETIVVPANLEISQPIGAKPKRIKRNE